MAGRINEEVHPLVKKVLASKPPIAKLIGFEVDQIELGHATALLEAGPQHANPMGTLLGDVLCDVADAAMGMAFASTLKGDESFTTINITINFFRPVWKEGLRAEARVINRGKNVGYVECEITSSDGKQVATATSTCFVLHRTVETTIARSRTRAEPEGGRPHEESVGPKFQKRPNHSISPARLLTSLFLVLNL